MVFDTSSARRAHLPPKLRPPDVQQRAPAFPIYLLHLDFLQLDSQRSLRMNLISNIWNHPTTSAAGVLIATVTVAGVLSQQGVNLGRLGSGTVVSLISAIATALLGLLARDPVATTRQSPSSKQARLGAWAMIALLIPLPWMQGCTASTVAQDIVNWTPALESAVATVDSTAAIFAPSDAPIFAAATSGFDAASNLLVAQAKAYLANPSAGILAQLQTQIVTFQQQVNAALPQAARITNPASQQHALAVIQGVGTIVSAILSLIQSVSGKTQLALMASGSHIKLAAVQPYLNPSRSAQIIAAHYNEPLALARAQVAHAMCEQIHAGF
jgi:hypothetical protein